MVKYIYKNNNKVLILQGIIKDNEHNTQTHILGNANKHKVNQVSICNKDINQKGERDMSVELLP